MNNKCSKMVTLNNSQRFLMNLKELRNNTNAKIKMTTLDAMHEWSFDANQNLGHQSGGFFSICGLRYLKNEEVCYQPIINQPEHGILGLLIKIVDGIVYLLVQYKVEPGNKDIIQVSPTVQATKSNYSRIHNGNNVKFIEYFLEEKKAQILYKQLQSEQGTKFYQKQNWNIVGLIDEDLDINIDGNHKWVSLGLVLDLLRENNIINMDLRSILGCFDLYSHLTILNEDGQLNTAWKQSLISDKKNKGKLISTLDWVNSEKQNSSYSSELVDLKQVFNKGWKFDNNRIYNSSMNEFIVRFVKVLIDNREVKSWDQPIVQDNVKKINGFLVKKIDGVYHFLVKLYDEIGLKTGCELGPTIHNIPVNQVSNTDFGSYFNGDSGELLYSADLSEEGGRFFHMENKYMLVEVEKDIEFSDGYRWLTTYEIKRLLEMPGYVNIEARSILASLDWRWIGYEEH